jgi:DNA-binding NarL/FixJ family response regulator
MTATSANESGDTRSKVVLVDDHPLVREWLTRLLNLQPDLTVCGEAGTASEALALVRAERPRMAIVDLTLKGQSGVELIKDLKAEFPELAVIVLSMHDEWLHAERALRAGARAYVVKQDAASSVLLAVRQVLAGKGYISARLAPVFAERYVGGGRPLAGPLVSSLSDRELEVFERIGRGYNTRRIAEEMRISFKTVQAFSARIKQKLHLDTATELLREAVRWHEGRQSPGKPGGN